MERKRLLLLGVVFEGGMLLLALALGAVLGAPPFGSFRLDGAGLGWGLAGCLPMLALLWGVERSASPLFAVLKRDIDEVVAKLFARCTIADLAILSILAGIGEEALFRGFIQGSLSAAAGPLPALALASLLFGLAHFISPAYALYAALVGLFLGGLLTITGNILAPMVVHGLYDFIALAWLVHGRRPRPEASAPAGP